MRKLLIGAALLLPLAAFTAPASAMPNGAHRAALDNVISSQDIVEVKGGRGGGRGFGRGGKFKPYGFSRGRKVGWRGRGCPPGLYRQGRC